MQATTWGYLPLVKYMCEQVTSLWARDRTYQRTMSHDAAGNGHIAVVKYLYEKQNSTELVVDIRGDSPLGGHLPTAVSVEQGRPLFI